MASLPPPASKVGCGGDGTQDPDRRDLSFMRLFALH